MNHFEQIEAYLGGEMNAEEKASFEALLQENAALKKDYDEWLQTEAIITKHEAAEAGVPALKKTLEPLTRDYFNTEQASQKGRVVSFKKYVYAAMAAAAILAIFFFMPGSIDNYDINPMPGAVVRGKEDATKKGAQLFNEAKYAEALPYLAQNAAEDTASATANFYYAVALIKTENATAALPLFEKLAEGGSVYKEDSYFFAALAAYKINNKEVAEKYASRAPENNQYYKHAQRLLKKLR